jgi:uncharacterized membrane protein
LALFIILCISVVICALPAVAQTRSVFWIDWNVEINNIDTANNQFDVREIYNVRFDGSFTFGSAIIEDTNLEGIRNIEVFEAGRALQASCSNRPGTYCVENVQEGVSITYYFRQPISNDEQNFEIHYTVVGALRVYDGGDQLWWTAIPSEHYGFRIGQSTVTVQMPPRFEPREGVDPIETYGAPSEISVAGGRVVATSTREIGSDEKFEIRVQYPHDPNARTPAWQNDFDDRRKFEENIKPLLDVALIAIALLIALGGPLGIYALWYTRGRDPKVGPVPEYLSELPSDLPPAIVGTLVDEKADVRDVMSTIIDLGKRGYLVIEEDKTEGIFGIGGKSEFTFKRTDKPLTGLRNFETRIVNKVFGGKEERTMDSLKNKFYQYIPSLQGDLYDELVTDGLCASKPSTVRSIYSGIGTAILVVAGLIGFLAFGGVENISETLLCIPFALGFTGVGFLIVGQHMPAKTRKGAEETAKWNAFREYLRNLEKYDRIEDVSAKFDQFLPYAIAFGIDRSWIRRFSKVSNTGIPIWYYPTYRGGYYSGGYRAGSPLPKVGLPSANDVLPGDLARAGGSGGLDSMARDFSGGLESISDGLTKMLNSASSTFTSRPQSSGSGSWSSGGSRWSGGGSRGGGSSGGGSRGFG